MEEVTISGNLASNAIDFSLLALFLRADLVVKSVIIILVIASVYSWTVIISKIVRMRQLKKLDIEFDEIFGPEIPLRIYMIPLIIIKTI